MLCRICKDLSIEQLIALAEVELRGQAFPQEAYYKHHASYADLINSSTDGCELCEIIYRGFQETIMDSSAPYWEGSTMDAAIQDIGAQGHATDLKICIHATHLYSLMGIKDVRLFDILMVQAGRVEPIPNDEDYDEDFDNWEGITPLQLILNVPRERPIYCGEYRIGRYETDSSLGSNANNELARKWLKECASSHADCVCSKNSKLPSRVLEVGTLEDPKIRIYISDEVEGEYVALSHCWGGVISPLLTTENLVDFQTSISFFDLPANFRDAITITRELGIMYLWIDSLCIIQNSKEDWEVESKKMCSIYRDAKVMISAVASARSTDGILKNDGPTEIRKNAVALKLSANNDSGDVAFITERRAAPQDLRRLLINCPLHSRGWTLQEGLLAPRILYYGQNQIYWRCQKGFQSADGSPPGNFMPEDEGYSELSKIIHSHIPLSLKEESLDVILEEYYRLVTEYSARNLSFEADKLPAFSGIAEILHLALGGEYLAGIWSRDLQGLLWYREGQFCRHVTHYRAPSWSWAVTNEPIIFEYEKNKGYKDIFEAQLISNRIELATQSPYGKIQSGEIVIKGFTKNLVRSGQTVVDSSNDEEKKYNFGSIKYDDDKNFGRLFHIQGRSEDYLLSVVEISRWQDGKEVIEPEFNIDPNLFSKQNHIALLIKSQPLFWEGADSLYRSGSGLILAQEHGNDNTYTRVGFFDISRRYKPDFEEWMESWETRTVTII